MNKTLFDLPPECKPHPAKYSDQLFWSFLEMLKNCNRILDPFAGTGKIFILNFYRPNLEIEAIEIEPEWANHDPRITLGNALDLPWENNYFDGICTSPTYGNRMADTLIDDYDRVTYTSKLGKQLHSDNSGSLQWGKKYKDFHIKAWIESQRVLCPGGIFVLNCKNHIRGGKEQKVTEWHIQALEKIGFEMLEHKLIECPGMRYGENSGARMEFESVVKFKLKGKRNNG